jgi:hypothetical protein
MTFITITLIKMLKSSVNMLSVAMKSLVLSVIMLNVVTPNYYKNKVYRMGFERMIVWLNSTKICTWET